MGAVQKQILEKALQFDMRKVVERYAKDEELSIEDALEHERELKRYLALVSSNQGVVYGMCGPIDNLWHTFITFTELYQKFGEHVAGRFIHHYPNENVGDRSDSEERKHHYARFERDYSESFGECPPKHLWPYAMSIGAEVTTCSTCRCCVALTD
jgi:hypothetical protein